MKRVFDNRQLAHVWAQQTQSEGRGSNMFFDGDTIYSYGRHFAIARFLDEKTVLFTERKYSVSTSKHISYVRRAIRAGVDIISCHNPAAHNENENHSEFKRQIDTALSKAMIPATRSKDAYFAQAAGAIANGNKYAQALGLDWRFDSLTPEMQKMAADAIAARQAREAKAAEKKTALHAVQLKRWISGEIDSAPRITEVFCRVKNDEVQTTLGARIPADHARRAWPLIKKAITGEPYHRNGHTIRLGEFSLDSVDSELLVAGCHRIKRTEVERVAGLLGLQ